MTNEQTTTYYLLIHWNDGETAWADFATLTQHPDMRVTDAEGREGRIHAGGLPAEFADHR